MLLLTTQLCVPLARDVALGCESPMLFCCGGGRGTGGSGAERGGHGLVATCSSVRPQPPLQSFSIVAALG